MNVNLAKALKVKNRLAGELTRLRNVLKRENSRRNDNPSKIDPKEVDVSIKQIIAKLVATKSAITRANIDIYSTLVKLEEAKSEISYLQTLPVKEGVEKTAIGYNTREVIEYNWTAYLNQSSVDNRVKDLQTQADELQDEVDSYNATHSVEIPD
jgi:hypothetical protein